MKIGSVDPASITLKEQLAEVEREIEFRWRVYPKWVAAKRMPQSRMDKQIAALIAVRDGLRERLRSETEAQRSLL